MSAFLCGPAHIGQLAAFIRSDPHRQYSPAELAECWAVANLQSVAHRYRHLTLDAAALDFLGCDAAEYIRECVAASGERSERTPVEVLKMSRCLDYQCCEPPEWETSTARRRLTCLESVAMAQLPGYDAAPWEYTPAEVDV